MMVFGKWNLIGKPAAALLCLHLLSVPGESAEPANMSAACDTARNHEKWYLKHRECGATDSTDSTGSTVSSGSQFSLLANFSKPEVRGSQYSFLANVATENVTRVQASGTFNLARSADEQLFAHVNIAKRIRTMQLGGVNIADTVEGTQIGYLNIANRVDGFGIGLLTIAGNGLLHVDASVEETGMEKLTFASGKGFFTSYSLGYTIGEQSHPYAFGMGFGYHKGFGGWYAEGELQGNLVLDKYTVLKDLEENKRRPGDSDWRNNMLFQGKLRLGRRLFGGVGLFGGLTYNALVFDENDRLLRSWSEDRTTVSKGVAWWPGAEIGIRLGR